MSAWDKSIEDSRFTFSNKVEICRILGLFANNQSDDLEKQINIINKLRNGIAHTLSFEDTLLQEIFKYHPNEVVEFNRYKKEPKEFNIFRGIIPFLYGNIIGRLESKEINKIQNKKNSLELIKHELRQK